MISRNYFIIGGSSSIGESLIKKLKNLNKVSYTYNKNKIKEFAGSQNITSIKLNLNSKKDISNLKKYKKKIDVLILCAAQTKFINEKNFKQLTPKLFEKIINGNLSTSYEIVYNLLGKLNKDSHLIFVSSIAAKNSIGSNVAYSCSKAGLNILTKFFSRVLGKHTIVNAIAPGLMKTNFTKNFDKNYFNNYRRKSATKVLTRPEQVADLIINISSKKMNLNGQVIYLDGGIY